MNLTSYESPTPSSRATTLEPRHRVLGARGHSNPGEGCGGLEALVSRHNRLRPDGAAWRESCSPCPGNRTVTIERSWLHLYGRVKQLGNRRREGEWVSKIEPHSLSPVNLGLCTKLNKVYGLTTPNEVAAVGAWLVVGERVRACPQKEPL
jgi:hypothetical protein